MSRIKLGIITLHPNYYHDGIWVKLSQTQTLEPEVLYLSDYGVKNSKHPDFGVFANWSSHLKLDAYRHVFLKNFGVSHWPFLFHRINPSLLWRVRKYTVVMIHGYDSFSSWITVLSSKFWGIRVLFRGEANLRQHEDDRWKQCLKRLLLSRLFGMVDAVLYSCTGNREFFTYYGVPEEKMFLIPCAVDNDFFQKERMKWAPLRSEIKAELGLSPESFVVIFAARWKALKRPLDLLHALKLLQDRGRTDIAAVFVGEGSERANMEAFIQKHNLANVCLVGFQDQTRISMYYSIGDVGVVLSDYDPSPKAMNEMMNFAMPIICTDVVGTARDLVHEGENGFIVEVGDVESVAQHIQYLADHRETARRMGERSLEIVSRWNFDRDVEAIEAAVEYVMTRK